MLVVRAVVGDATAHCQQGLVSTRLVVVRLTNLALLMLGLHRGGHQTLQTWTYLVSSMSHQ